MLSPRRIWDVDDKRKQKTVIVIKSKERGARTKVNACAYSNDGGLIAAGLCIFHILLEHIVDCELCFSVS